MRQRIAGIVLIAIYVFLGANCSPSIKHLRFNPLKEDFEATTAKDTASSGGRDSWFTLRNNFGMTVIRDSASAGEITREYNAFPLLKRKLSFVRIELNPKQKVDRFAEFKAGRRYFSAIEALSKGNPDSALVALQDAEDNNPNLLYGSDLNYLRAVAFLRRGDTALAANAFATFCAFSEAVYSPTFNLSYREPDSLYLRTLKNAQAQRDSGFERADNARANDCPRLAAPWYVPGFRFPETDKPGLFGIGLGYSNKTGMLGALEAGKPFSCGLMPYAGFSVGEDGSSVHSGLLWRAFRNKTNTFGIEAATTLSLTTDGHISMVKSNPLFPQASLRLESGWVPVSRVSLFAGCLYPIFNQFNVWEDQGKSYSDKISPYGGVNLHLIGDLGLTGRYENDRWVAGVFINNLVFGYDGKGMYFNMMLW